MKVSGCCNATHGTCTPLHKEIELPFVAVGTLSGFLLGSLAVGGFGAGALGGAIGGFSSSAIQAMITKVRDPISLYHQQKPISIPLPSKEEIEKNQPALHRRLEIDWTSHFKKGFCFGVSMTLFLGFEKIRTCSWEEIDLFLKKHRSEVIKHQISEIHSVELANQGIFFENPNFGMMRVQNNVENGIILPEMERGMVSFRTNASEGHMIYFQNEDSFYRIYDPEKGGYTFPNREKLFKHLNQLLQEGTEPILYA